MILYIQRNIFQQFRNNISLMKEKGNLAKLRMIDCNKPAPIRLNSKQALKEAIIDFIIHDMSGAVSSYTRKVKNRKYEPINLRLDVNGSAITLSIELPALLMKYASLLKTEKGSGMGIQELTTNILEFIQKLEDQAALLSIDVPGEPTAEKVVAVLAERHLREKQRESLQDQYDAVKKTLATKYKKVIFNSEGDRDKKEGELAGEKYSEENSQRVSRSTVTAILEKEESGKKHLQVPTKSRLKALVDSCNVFDFPDKVEALRRERIIAEFCGGKEAELIAVRQEVKKHYPCSSNSSLTVETMHQLEEWINDISVSEALFKRKYEPQNEQKQAKKQVDDSSSSDDDLP